MPKPKVGPDALKCIAYLKTRPLHTKVLTSDLAKFSNVPTNNILAKLYNAQQAGKLLCDKVNSKVFLWYLTESEFNARPPRIYLVEEEKPASIREQLVSELPSEVYVRTRRTEDMTLREHISDSRELTARISRFIHLENNRTRLSDLMNKASPAVTGDPHMALAQLMRVARLLHERKRAPFSPVAIDIHIAMELRKVVDTIEEATGCLIDALQTLDDLNDEGTK